MFFSQFVGQNDIKEYLIKSIQEKNVSHGYIFEGSKGIGKYQLALTFAQALLCKSFYTEPCNSCDSCIKVNSFNHPDLHLLSSTDNKIKRKDIDELIESINRKPYESDKKVYIIKDAETMTPEASNTFLKTLEEPIGNTVIILLTENSSLLLPTIVSRCQIIKFRSIDNDTIIKYLVDNYKVDYNKARLVAYYSEGILSKAKNIITGQDDTLERRTEIIKIFDKVIKSDKNIIYEYEKYFEEFKVEIDEILDIFMIWLRDISFKKHNVDNLIINSDYFKLLSEHSDIININKINELIIYLQKVSNDVKNNVNYKLIIDNMLLKIQEETV